MTRTTTRLRAMMFLEHGVRGMWYPLLANYLRTGRGHGGLGFTGAQSGWVLGFAASLGAVSAPVVGRVVDRHLNAEKALAALHVLSGILLFVNASSTTFGLFLAVMIGFSIAYAPTQSLTNSLALSHLTDPEHTFPRVRLWGTIGWIVTSSLFTIVFLNADNSSANVARIPWALRSAGVMAMAYATFAYFVLPPTPPLARSLDDSARAVSLLRNRSVLVLCVMAVPVSAIHTAYYFNIGPFMSDQVGVPLKWVGPTLALAQVSEVACLFVLGPILRRFGYTTVLTVGVLTQALRFVVFAVRPPAVIVCAALSLHGVAFACFFTTATLYVERVAPPRMRHTAQTAFGILLFGLGPALAGRYEAIFDRWSIGATPNFRAIWFAQAAIAAACAAVLAALFRPKPAVDLAGQPSDATAVDAAATLVE